MGNADIFQGREDPEHIGRMNIGTLVEGKGWHESRGGEVR